MELCTFSESSEGSVQFPVITIGIMAADVETKNQPITITNKGAGSVFLHFLQQKEHKEAFLELANIVANADGFVSLKEKGGLRIIAAELDLTAAPAASRSIADILSCVQDERVQHIFMVEILLLCYVDGDYNDDEKAVIMEMKQRFNISDEKYEAFKEWVLQLDKLRIAGVKLILDMP